MSSYLVIIQNGEAKEYKLSPQDVMAIMVILDNSISNEPIFSKYRVVTTAGLLIRANPSTKSPRKGLLQWGDIFTVYETLENSGYLWGRHDKGWSALRGKGLVFASKVREG